MLEQIIAGIMENILLVLGSLTMLLLGTATAYKKFGLKRVLLGKTNEHLELIYRNKDKSIDWKPTSKVWIKILTGGMSLLSVFLLILILTLAMIYSHDIQATRDNDGKLCEIFGTIYVSEEEIFEYMNGNQKGVNTQFIFDSKV